MREITYDDGETTIGTFEVSPDEQSADADADERADVDSSDPDEGKADFGMWHLVALALAAGGGVYAWKRWGKHLLAGSPETPALPVFERSTGPAPDLPEPWKLYQYARPEILGWPAGTMIAYPPVIVDGRKNPQSAAERDHWLQREPIRRAAEEKAKQLGIGVNDLRIQGPGTIGLTSEERAAWLAAAEVLQLPIDTMISVANSESLLSRYALNPLPAAGLFQLTLGAKLPGFDTKDKIREVAESWDTVRQVREIGIPLWKPYAGAGAKATPGWLYRRNFLPADANRPDDFRIGDETAGDNWRTKVYLANPGFDPTFSLGPYSEGKERGKDARRGWFTNADVDRVIGSKVKKSAGRRVAVDGTIVEPGAPAPAPGAKPKDDPKKSEPAPPARAGESVIVWTGPISAMQAKPAVPPGWRLANITCTGDGAPTCADIAERWTANDRKLPGLMKAAKVRDGEALYLGAFSAGGQIVKRALKNAEDRARVRGVLLSDATYTATWGNAKKAKLGPMDEGFLLFAIDAVRDGRPMLATVSSNPNKDMPSGAQTLRALKDELERRGVLFDDAQSDPLWLTLEREPIASWRANNVLLADFGDRYKHAEHAEEIAPAVWPLLARRDAPTQESTARLREEKPAPSPTKPAPADKPSPVKPSAVHAARVLDTAEPTSSPAAGGRLPDSTPIHGLMLEAVEKGQDEEPEWTEIPYGDLVVTVGKHVLRAKLPGGELLRLPVSYRDQVEIAKRKGWVLPTPDLAKAIWQASNKIDPVLLGDWSTPDKVKESSKAQGLLSNVRKHDAGIEREIAELVASGDFDPNKPTAPEGKDWVLWFRNGVRALGAGKGFGAQTYGQFKKDGKPIQPLGDHHEPSAHNDKHRDQTQTKRPIKRMAKRGATGEPVDLLEYWRGKVGDDRLLDALR